MSHPSLHPNQIVLQCLFDELNKLGVEEFCIAAGARNAPIISALYDPASQVKQVYNFFEERCAGFFALGRAISSRKPVAVVTTSGTAAAELLPAVIEAFYQQVPLILITADRPKHYRNSGAPQAIEQLPLFESYLQARWDIEFSDEKLNQQVETFHPASGSFPAFPTHFNVCLDEQVVNDISYPGGTLNQVEISPSPQSSLLSALSSLESSGLLVLTGAICPSDAPFVAKYLAKLGAPILAEETSNLSHEEALQPLLIQGGEAALRNLEVKQVLRIGGVPSWRWWRDLEEKPELPVLNLAIGGFSGLGRKVQVSTLIMPRQCQWQSLPVAACQSPVDLKRIDMAAIDMLCQRYPQAEPSFLWCIEKKMPAYSQLFLGNSLAIRYWNKLVTIRSSARESFANRGANGIDGLISTWLGASQEADNSAIILGDLSTLYDLAGPWIKDQLKPATRKIFILNNGGGKIFSNLSWLKQVSHSTKSAFENSHDLRFEHWAAMWNMKYSKCTQANMIEWEQSDMVQVYELIADDQQTQAFWTAFESLI